MVEPKKVQRRKVPSDSLRNFPPLRVYGSLQYTPTSSSHYGNVVTYFSITLQFKRTVGIGPITSSYFNFANTSQCACQLNFL